VTPRRALIATVALAVGAVELARDASAPGLPCQGLDAPLAGVWDDGTRAAVRGAFVATGRPGAADAFEHVAAALDAYTRAWVASRTEACLATEVRGEQSATLRDLRMACLERRLGAVRGLTALFARGPDVELLPHAAQAVLALEPLDGCSDTAALTAAAPPPREPERCAWLTALGARLDRVDALALTGKYRPAYALANVTVVEARALGHPPALARALAQLARLDFELALPAERVDREDAVVAAGLAGDDALVASNLAGLISVLAVESRFAEVHALRPALEAAAERCGNDRLRAEVHDALGNALGDAGELAEAERELRAALELRERTEGPDGFRVGRTLASLGRVLSRRGKLAEARAKLARGLAIIDRQLGLLVESSYRPADSGPKNPVVDEAGPTDEHR
jgi:serine/threonine-protein kinase